MYVVHAALMHGQTKEKDEAVNSYDNDYSHRPMFDWWFPERILLVCSQQEMKH